jgi:hypothetical protein
VDKKHTCASLYLTFPQLQRLLESNSWMTVNKELERIQKEVVLSFYKVLSQQSLEKLITWK